MLGLSSRKIWLPIVYRRVCMREVAPAVVGAAAQVIQREVTRVDTPFHQAADDVEHVAPDLVLSSEVEILAKICGYKRKIDEIDIGFVTQLARCAFYDFFDHGTSQ
ncbi:hypothetical protein [Lichenibacterium ramalinae]|uniref:Uncharacterized protein n=1 Tax=Lichenibacterium ramalinae TaxID=2316527 RepID=A0A4Q2RB58_9HYPH|nr:hypothetical protein [Lichenibacterium ramalinae]RYB03239.1 hypothetical protein D3272_17600 [Lichenibacterium ramalinae]